MANFAILRVEKLKDRAEVVRSLKHCFREQETPNADPARLESNRHFGAASVDTAMKALEARLPAKLRKNGVLVLEYLITASPEALTAMPKEQCSAYLADALGWLRKRHGADNVFVATEHQDETTPHLSVFIVPKDKRGRMNARDFTGGRGALAKMQTDFAENVGRKYGLERGIERSGAHHIPIREYYWRVNQAEKQKKNVETTLNTQQKVGLIDKGSGRVSPEIEEAVKANAALAAEVKRLAKENENLKRAVAAQASERAKEKAAEVRELALADVLKALGGIPGRDNCWDTPAGFVLTDPKRTRWFHIENSDVQGRGAIDLVKAVDGKSFDEAVIWLHHVVLEGKSPESLKQDAGKAAAEEASAEVEKTLEMHREAKPVTLHVAYEGEEVEIVRNYFTQQLQLSKTCISKRIANMELGAALLGVDTCAVISGQDSPGKPTRHWHLISLETGDEYSRGKPESFQMIFKHGDKNPAHRSETAAIFTESPLDAMAIYTAFQNRLILPTFRCLYVIATNGISFDQLKETIRGIGKKARAFVSGFSRDEHGRTMTGHLTRALNEENIERDNEGMEPVPFPQGCTRWIEVLRRWQEVEQLRYERLKKKEKEKGKQATRSEPEPDRR